MNQEAKKEVFKRVRYHYKRSVCRREKGRLLDTLCRMTGWGRKYAINALHGRTGPDKVRIGGVVKHGGSRPRYEAETLAMLKQLWLASGQLCGKRLVPVLPAWLDSWERRHGPIDTVVRGKVLSISPAQADRVLSAHKVKGRRIPRPASEVRRQIAVRSGPWEVDGPGWIEADTVSHCGGDPRGSHGWSVVLTDIASGWTEARMSWNRSDLAVHACIAQIESHIPFTIKGFDSDNGGEFINHTLLRYWRARERAVEVTRSRPWHKNDNAHIEQKNLALVRENLGYERVRTRESAEAFSEVLRLLSLRANLYQASAKLVRKESRPGRRARKIYEKRARTPWQRLMDWEALPEAQRQTLVHLMEYNDPLTLNEQIESTLLVALRLNEREGHQAEDQAEIQETRQSGKAA